MSDKKISNREKIAIIILLFIVKIMNPTGYSHQFDELKKAIDEEL